MIASRGPEANPSHAQMIIDNHSLATIKTMPTFYQETAAKSLFNKTEHLLKPCFRLSNVSN